MRQLKSALLFTIVALGALCSPAWAQIPTLPPDGGSRLESPTCASFNVAGQPTSDFRAGDELILRGTNYPPGVLVLVTFRQPPYSAEMARFKTSAAGDFTSEPTILRVPADSAAGHAQIHVASSGGSGSCALELTALSATIAQREAAQPKALSDEGEESEGVSAWLIVWATLVALGGGYLAFVTYRRSQAARLEERMARLNQRREARQDRPQAPPRLEELNLPSPRPQPPEPDSPPVLPIGWDAGREPIPVRDPYKH